MKTTLCLFISLFGLSALATAEDGKPFRLANTNDVRKPCVEGVEVTLLNNKAERSPSYNASPTEFLEPLKHPFLTNIILPNNLKEISVVNLIVKNDPRALCQAVEKNARTYTVRFGEEYKGMGTAYNAQLTDKDGKVAKFQITLKEDETIISAYEIVDGKTVFYREIP